MEDNKSCRIHWFYGKTGTGKTEELKNIIRDKIKEGEIKIDEVFDASQKFCGYYLDNAKGKNIKIVYIDNLYDEKNDTIKLRDIVSFLNGSYIRVKFEGKTFIQPEDIYITSLYKPEEVYRKYKNKEAKDYIELINHIIELRKF